MSAPKIQRVLAGLLVAAVASGCGSSGSGSGAQGGVGPGATADGGPSAPPIPLNDSVPCVISADCPAGEHCDLSACVQDCSTKDPCTGQLTCSPRARCLPPGQPDTDPPPSTNYAGSFAVSPASIRLSDRDAYFDVRLTAKATQPVRYRIQLDGPHLGVDQLRGEFKEATTIRFHVDPSKLTGRDVAGSIKFFTTLGNAMIDAPIHVGVTGSYQGSLRYRSNSLTLGDTRIALDILERNGNVSVRVDSKSSLLFPATLTGETTGHGQFTASNGLDFTVAQVVEPTFGGARNHFRRPVGRQVRVQVKPNSNGDLVGTFTEMITGLYSEPTQVTGDANLEFHPTGTDPEFNVAPDPAMPPSPSKATSFSPTDVFGWANTDCNQIVCGCDSYCGCNGPKQAAALAGLDAVYSAPLYAAFASRGASNPIEDIATACTASLGAHSFNEWSTTAGASQCGVVPALACGLLVRAQETVSDVANGQASVALVNELLAPALLVAKNEVVGALSDSFSKGASAEAQRYDTAMTALGPSAAWVMQPSVLEYLRNLSPQAAKGRAPAAGDTSTQSDTYPAARALADLFYTSSVIDGERARMGAAASSGSQPQLAKQAQERALLTYLEAMTVSELVRAWGTVPNSVAVKYTGILTPLNQGFTALQQGANAFGVPSDFVPFVFRPEDVGKGATNFEQMLGIAASTVSTEKNLEAQFIADKRQYELNQQQLQQQLTSVRLQFDQQIKTICGAPFDPNSITSADDWNKCGANQTGDVGALGAAIDVANAKVASSQSRIYGMKDKIKIDSSALAQTQKLREDDIKFISATGDSLAALTFTDGVLNSMQQAIQIAANASIMNLGAPLAEAGPELAIGLMRTAIATQKQQLETAQSVQAAQTSAAVEYINGMAAIQKEMIDFAQLSVDILQDALSVLEAQVQQRNKVAQAQSLYDERQRDLGLLNKDPSNDPSYRLLRDQLALQLLSARADAQHDLYLGLTAMEYELNMSVAAIDGAVLNANNGTNLDALQSCALKVFNGSRIAYGTPQDYVTVVSVRQLLGISGPRTDTVTGQTLSEGEQFRELLLRNENLDGRGGVGILFATDLKPGNKLWADDVCDDRIATIQAQLVGDFLGDDQAQVNLSLNGGSVMRACDSGGLVSWTVGTSANNDADAFAVLQSGVNDYGGAPPNTSLFGQSVARASWKLVIPGGSDAPTNADVDLTHVDDVVLKIDHKALPHRSSPIAIDVSCLAQIGGGQ